MIVRSRTARLVVGLAATALVVTACGSRSTGSGSGSTATSSSGSAKTVKIGVIAPLSGDLSAVGLGIRNAVDLAVKQANEKKTVNGYTLTLDA